MALNLDLPTAGERGWAGKVIDAFGQISTELSDASISSKARDALSPVAIHMSGTTHPLLTTDAAAALTQVCSAAPAGSTIYIAPGSYPTSSAGTIDFAQNLSVKATGVKFTRTSGKNIILTVAGAYGPQRSVSAIEYKKDAVLTRISGLTVATLASGHGLSVGDFAKMIADDGIPGGRVSDPNEQPRLGEHLLVIATTPTTVTFIGQPFEKEKYLTNIRVARLMPGGFRLDGMAFDVSDAIASAGNTAAAVLRCDSALAPVLNDVEVVRAVGPSIQMRSCLNYRILGARIGWGMNNGGNILGYGIQDNGSQGGHIIGCSFRFVRHAYDDKSTEDGLVAGSSRTSAYGRTLWPVFSQFSIEYSGDASVSTHQESYGVTISDGVIRGTGEAGAISLRGLGHKVSDVLISNCEAGITVSTESGYPSGESRQVHASNITMEDVSVAIIANIHGGKVHNSASVQDTERNLTVDGLVGRRIRSLGIITNARVVISDYDVSVADNPGKHFLSVVNSEVTLGGTQVVDGRNVTTTASDESTLINSTSLTSTKPEDDFLSSVNPRNRIVQLGSLFFEPSAYYAGRMKLGAVSPDPFLDIVFPSPDSLVVNIPIGGGVFSATTFRKQCVFGWRYVPHADFPERSTGSGSLVLTNSQLAGVTGVNTLTAAPNDNLFLTATMPDNTNRTLAKLPSGQRTGQRLTIFRAGGAADLLVRNGAAGGTTLLNGDVTLPNAGVLRLEWVGSSWRQFA